MLTRTIVLRFAAASLALAAATALQAAAPAAPAPVVGTLVAVAKDSLQLRTSELQQVTIALGAQTRIVDTVNITMADVKSGDFLGTTAAPKEGRLVASEVHVFDEALRGTGEGHYPWTQPGSTMTNGAVATMTNGAAKRSADGVTMTVTYKGGQQQVTVPPGIPMTRVKVVDASRLAVGQRVTVFGQPRDEKIFDANLISLTPPTPAGR